MNTRFKIGDEIFYMDFSEPKKATVKGVAVITGEFKNHSFDKNGTEEKPAVVYSVGSFFLVDDEKAFATKEDLQSFLFLKL